MTTPTLRERLRYKFDTFISKGGRSIFFSLVVVFLVLFGLLAGLRGVSMLMHPKGVSHETHDSFLGQSYIIFLELTDPGNMNQDKFASPLFKVSGVLAGLAGVIILSMLIAFITTALDQKLSELRKGFSRVIESDHTLILGWNHRVPEILRELIIANESEDDACVVILADLPKEEMDDYLKVHVTDRQTTRIVTRSGKPSAKHNLEIVSLPTSKSVVILASCGESANEAEKAASDIRTIKTILGVVASKEEGTELNIVVELFQQRSREIAEEISPEVTAIDGQEILAKLLVQTSRSLGLSVVYAEVLSFDGCELYFHQADWSGIAFGKAIYHFPDGVPIGLRHADGTVVINPESGLMLQKDDDILILAEDDSTIEFRSEPVAVPQTLPLAEGRKSEPSIERELLIGWNEKVPLIVREYADYVQAGSQIDIMMREPTDYVRQTVAQLNESLENLTIQLIESNPTDIPSLTALQPFHYDNIIILSSGDQEADSETSDSETIVILILLRRIFSEAGPDIDITKTKIITEVMDSDNQELVARAGVHDFIISNRFVSTILAQISEEASIKAVYDDLFSEDGSEIYLKPARLYFTSFPIEVSFADMMAIAQQRNEVCIGVKIQAMETDMQQNFGVKLIPEKNTRWTLGPEDRLVVVAEDET
ncbi:CASTOR/POLLUX-related putative ion channel [Bremerella cremea]|uniref:CASTOR/POLLUX-related putative ion channel n=1 Tax=Bremerella cremea TaxID=1031537 RepID=UPI0031E9E246